MSGLPENRLVKPEALVRHRFLFFATDSEHFGHRIQFRRPRLSARRNVHQFRSRLSQRIEISRFRVRINNRLCDKLDQRRTAVDRQNLLLNRSRRMLTRLKLRLRSAKPSAPQGCRSRFRWRDARKEATQNIGGERRACEQVVKRLPGIHDSSPKPYGSSGPAPGMGARK